MDTIQKEINKVNEKVAKVSIILDLLFQEDDKLGKIVYVNNATQHLKDIHHSMSEIKNCMYQNIPQTEVL